MAHVMICIPLTVEPSMSYYATETIDRAAKMYFRWHERTGRFLQQPNRHECDQVGDKVRIRNCNGDLARYRLLPDGRMRRIWPRSV